MADTLSPTELDMDETELDMNELLHSIEYFSAQIIKIRAEDNFIQEKINQISIQIMRFGIFVEESISQSIKMQNYAGDLVVFAERCNGFSREVLLRILRSLSRDSRVYKSEATLLKQQIKSIVNSFVGIAKEISEYNDRIKERKVATIVAGLGFTAAVASILFTGGASLVALGFGGLAGVGGAAIAGISTTNANTSSNESIKLNYQLESVREEFSQHLQMMRNGLENVAYTIFRCEFYWERQIIDIEDIIRLLERGEQRIIKINSRSILTKAKKICANSEEYSLILEEFFK
ncbi:unnamed protein product [Rhizophagus irregularis]|nr:unnamed protein product [Rhizophagus irregularis]